MSLLSRVRGSEGLRLKAYPDPRSPLAIACRKAHLAAENYAQLPGWQRYSGSPWTIAYGHTGGVHEGDTCTIAQAETWLVDDIKTARYGLELALPWTRTLDQARHDVLVDMAFNMGITRIEGFADTLAAVRRGDWAAAAAEMMDSDWARELPRRATQLARIMRTGVDE